MLKLAKYRQLCAQFIPMSASDMVMALSDPIIVFVLASLPNGTLYLAAFALGKSITVFFESPVISVLPTSNAFAYQARARQLLFRFVFLLGTGLSLAMLLLSLGLPDLSATFDMDPAIWSSALLLVLLLTPWPLAIAIRRFWQGHIIRAGFPKRIAQGSLLRCVLVAAAAFGIASFTHRGEWVAAGAMLLGVFGELLFIHFQAQKITLQEVKPAYPLPQNLSQMSHYYWPLAQSMMYFWGARLMLPFLIATTGTLNIAAWAAGWALVISISNGVRMIQQLVIRYSSHIAINTLRFFTLGVGVSFSLVLLVIAITPWGQAFSIYYGGQNPALGEMISQVIMASSPLPMLMALQNYLQGLLMVKTATSIIGRAALLANIIMVLGVALLTVFDYPLFWVALAINAATGLEVLILALCLKLKNQAN